jgi:hypothetical protein
MTQPPRTAGISHAWRALRHRNFRLYFGGQGISLIGTWMTRIATSWLVYRLTKSALLLGTVPSPASGSTGSTGARFWCGRKHWR